MRPTELLDEEQPVHQTACLGLLADWRWAEGQLAARADPLVRALTFEAGNGYDVSDHNHSHAEAASPAEHKSKECPKERSRLR